MSESSQTEVTPATRARLRGTAMASNADAYVERLVAHGYAPGTITGYLSCVAHFAHWADCERIGLSRIDEAVVVRFLDCHLPSCDCAARWRRGRIEARAALTQLLNLLRTKRLIAHKGSSVPPSIAAELRDFGIYLTEVRGLQAVTRDTRCQHVRSFLRDRFGETGVEMLALGPNDIEQFIMSFTDGWKPASVRAFGNSLRSYLRYKAVFGDETRALIAAIPRVAQWRLASLPRALSASDVRTLLGAFNCNTIGGRRDYAIARCYVDLGLRTSEIVRLQLDDIDWRKGVMYVRGKGRRVDGLPLPKSTGCAISAYLRKGRANASNRALFLRLRAPLDRPAGPDTIRGALRNAAQRCGLSKRLTGPHVLRHTLATQLVRNGASFKEIADVLRHRSLDTTTIYAKVDLEALTGVAVPWPGSPT